MDLVKHQELFDAHHSDRQGEKLVVGVGSVGSEIALGLAKLGLRRIQVIDDDKVEPENIPNQYLYGPDDIGISKVSSAKRAIDRLTGIVVGGQHSKYTGRTKLNFHTVFSCVDSMAARSTIFNRGVFLNGTTQIFIDIRTGIKALQVLMLDPRNPAHFKAYREQLYPDEEAQQDRAKCGVTLSLGPIAQVAANLALHMFVQASRGQQVNYIDYILPLEGELAYQPTIHRLAG